MQVVLMQMDTLTMLNVVIYNGPDQDYQGEEICFNANEEYRYNCQC